MSDELTPPPDPTPDPAPDPTPAPVSEEAQLDQVIEEKAINLPEGERLIPLSVLSETREKARHAKAEAERFKADAQRATELEAENQRLKSQWHEAMPAVQAAQALLQAQQQPAPPQTPTVDTDAIEYAKDLDLYTPDGSPDVERARKILTKNQQQAEQMAMRATAPIMLDSLQAKARANLARAKNTAMPDGTKPDPAVLDELWAELGKNANGLQVLANEQQATHVFNQAYSFSVQRGTVKRAAQTPSQAPAAPLHRERSGGQETPSVTLTSGDKKTARDLGISDAEYAKVAAAMPWGRK